MRLLNSTMLIATAVFALADPATAQTRRLGWAQTFDGDEKPAPFRWAGGKKEPVPHVTLMPGLGKITSDAYSVPTSWSVPERELPALLRRYKCSVRGFVDPKRPGETVAIGLYPRDFSPQDRDKVIQHVVGVARPAERAFYLVVATPERERGLQVRQFRDSRQLETALYEAIPKEGPTSRLVVFQETGVLYISPPEAQRVRRQTVTRFVESYESQIKELKSADSAEAARAIANKLSKETGAFFLSLNRQNLTNDRTQAYEVLWNYEVRPFIVASPFEKENQEELGRFGARLKDSIDDGKCTVEVSSLPEPGATIQYAKAADADRGAFTEHAKPTSDTFEVERAKYVFQALRNKKKTGESGSIDCTVPHKTIFIQETK